MITYQILKFLFLEDGEPIKKNIEDLFKNKKVVMFGLPGAYTSYVLQSIYLAM